MADDRIRPAQTWFPRGWFLKGVEAVTAKGNEDPDYSRIFADNVKGVEEIDYDTPFEYAGLKLEIIRDVPWSRY